MNRFLLKGFLFFSIIATAVFFIDSFQKGSKINFDFMAAIADKQHRADTIKTSKIIIAGGSNLAFGIESSEIASQMRMPVVNMALAAGLGLQFILNQLKYTIKEGDIVLLSCEYFLDKSGDYGLKENAATYYPPAYNFYHKNYITGLERFVTNNRKIFKRLFLHFAVEQHSLDTTSIFRRKFFNPYGDFTGHLEKPNKVPLTDREVLKYKYWDGIEQINDFCDYASSKHVNVFFLFASYAGSEYNTNKNVIHLLEADLRKDLKAVILNAPEDFVYEDSYFFDTIYHLNKQGREKRTKKMIAILKANKRLSDCISLSR